MASLPADTRFVIVGSGFAGAATAWALGRAGQGPGVILEQEPSWGVPASGRNAAMVRLAESDPVVGALACRSLAGLRDLDRAAGGGLLTPVGGITLAGEEGAPLLPARHDALRVQGATVALLSPSQARARFPFLAHMEFHTALWCADDGVVDIHALLGLYLARAREAGFTLRTGCRAEALMMEGGRVTGVHTPLGDVRAEVVIDASGAWAGRLGRGAAPLPLQPFRRHLFVSAPTPRVPPDAPLVWVEDPAFYLRPESGGLLLSPCDESPASPGLPDTDPSAAESLAAKVAQHAPGLADLAIRRSWACLRTFAPDRLPVIGPDGRVPGLFHVSGLGGAGMMCSASVGELAADLLAGRVPDWIDPAALAPARLVAYLFTTVTVTLDGYAFEWWTTFCATTPLLSS